MTRTFARELWTDEFWITLPPEYRLLWIGLIHVCADDQGRMLDSPMQIKGQLFMSAFDSHITEDVVERGVVLLAKNKKIRRYVAGSGSNGIGRRLIQIRNWWRYQEKAGYMGRSAFPPPPNWIERINYQNTRINWDLQGGFVADGGAVPRVASKPQASGKPAAHQSLASINDNDKEEEKEKAKSLPPSIPPSKRLTSKADGWNDIAEKIQKIFTAAGFRDKRKMVLLSKKVATRSATRDPIEYVIASFASAFSNGKARDPIAIAIHQIENNQVNPAFEDPGTWRSVPSEIIRAAGIENLADYKIRRFQSGR